MLFYAQAAFAQAKPGSVLKTDWSTQHYVSDFFAINQVGNKATAGPLLVVIGTADDATPPAVIEAQAKKACVLCGFVPPRVLERSLYAPDGRLGDH